MATSKSGKKKKKQTPSRQRANMKNAKQWRNKKTNERAKRIAKENKALVPKLKREAITTCAHEEVVMASLKQLVTEKDELVTEKAALTLDADKV